MKIYILKAIYKGLSFERTCGYFRHKARAIKERIKQVKTAKRCERFEPNFIIREADLIG